MLQHRGSFALSPLLSLLLLLKFEVEFTFPVVGFCLCTGVPAIAGFSGVGFFVVG